MSVVRRGVVLAVAVLVAPAALGGCTSDGDAPAARPTPTITALSDLATEDVVVVRAGFCDRVDAQAVEDALGGEPSDEATWSNGERARVAPGLRDVVHEFGCAWTGPDQDGTAGAWVFAPPVTGREARRLGRAAPRADGCERVRDAERFGARSVAVTCRPESGPKGAPTTTPTTTYHGLFGDAWLSCSLTGTDEERTARWCAAVVRAAGAA